MRLPGFVVDSTVRNTRGRYASASAGWNGFASHGLIAPGTRLYGALLSTAASGEIAPFECTPGCGPCLPDSTSRTGCSMSCQTASCEPIDKPCTDCKRTSCPTGSVFCAGTCCAPGQVCSAGHCCPAGEQWSNGICCWEGGTNCNGSCVQLLTDPKNCGSCGHQCPTGMDCILGWCQSTKRICDPPKCASPGNCFTKCWTETRGECTGLNGPRKCIWPAGIDAAEFPGTKCCDSNILVGEVPWSATLFNDGSWDQVGCDFCY